MSQEPRVEENSKQEREQALNKYFFVRLEAALKEIGHTLAKNPDKNVSYEEIKSGILALKENTFIKKVLANFFSEEVFAENSNFPNLDIFFAKLVTATWHAHVLGYNKEQYSEYLSKLEIKYSLQKKIIEGVIKDIISEYSHTKEIPEPLNAYIKYKISTFLRTQPQPELSDLFGDTDKPKFFTELFYMPDQKTGQLPVKPIKIKYDLNQFFDQVASEIEREIFQSTEYKLANFQELFSSQKEAITSEAKKRILAKLETGANTLDVIVATIKEILSESKSFKTFFENGNPFTYENFTESHFSELINFKNKIELKLLADEDIHSKINEVETAKEKYTSLLTSWISMVKNKILLDDTLPNNTPKYVEQTINELRAISPFIFQDIFTTNRKKIQTDSGEFSEEIFWKTVFSEVLKDDEIKRKVEISKVVAASRQKRVGILQTLKSFWKYHKEADYQDESKKPEILAREALKKEIQTRLSKFDIPGSALGNLKGAWSLLEVKNKRDYFTIPLTTLNILLVPLVANLFEKKFGIPLNKHVVSGLASYAIQWTITTRLGTIDKSNSEQFKPMASVGVFSAFYSYLLERGITQNQAESFLTELQTSVSSIFSSNESVPAINITEVTPPENLPRENNITQFFPEDPPVYPEITLDKTLLDLETELGKPVIPQQENLASINQNQAQEGLEVLTNMQLENTLPTWGKEFTQTEIYLGSNPKSAVETFMSDMLANLFKENNLPTHMYEYSKDGTERPLRPLLYAVEKFANSDKNLLNEALKLANKNSGYISYEELYKLSKEILNSTLERYGQALKK